MTTRNRLREIRERAGVPAAALARYAGVSRQTIYAIESGAYVPNTATALLLARNLNSSVEEIFSLDAVDAAPPPQSATPLRGELHPGQPVRLCRVGRTNVAVPALSENLFLPEADAVVEAGGGNRFLVRPIDDAALPQRALIAGCDPALSLLARALRSSHIDTVLASAASAESLDLLRDGLVHIAGSHLRDSATGDYNLPQLRSRFAKGSLYVATFASWQEGLLVKPGNRKGIRSVAALARKGVSIANRQEGSGSRQLLDRLLLEAGVSSARVNGYRRILPGHLPAAWAVASGDADCCIATEAAARLFGLEFIPLAVERFDLVTLRRYLDLPQVRAVFDLLARSGVRRRLGAIAGYDVSQTGSRRS